MTGNEHLVLSGGVVNKPFLDAAIQQARAIQSGGDQLQVTIDQSGTPGVATFQNGLIVAERVTELYGAAVHHLQPTYGYQSGVQEAQHKLESSQLLYVSGGDTAQYLATWQRLHLKDYIAERVRSGSLAVCGASAGTLVCFEIGHSDSWDYHVPEGEHWEYRLLSGLGLFAAVATVHYDRQDNRGRHRSEEFAQKLRNLEGDWQTAIGLETAAALVCTNGITSLLPLRDAKASAYIFRSETGTARQQLVPGEQIPELSRG